jgi:uncharacterized protein (UPF0261 family)
VATVVLIGTLDTKGEEVAFLRERLHVHGCDAMVVDVGILGSPSCAADVPRAEVARAAGTSPGELAAAGDRGGAVTAMGRGAARNVGELHEDGRLAAGLAVGGSGGASLGAAALGGLPLGVPKMLVSTVVAGDTRPFVGDADFTLMYPVVDLAGLNRVSRRVLDNAAAGIAGMARNGAPVALSDEPLVGITMFGITTPCARGVADELRRCGYEPLVFSANGVGGRSMERLIAEARLVAVADVTTTELADRLVGGTLPAADGRLMRAGERGVPQVVSVGAMDVVNFGPWETVPEHFRGRRLHRHNAAVTLMRTSAEECHALGDELGRRVSAGHGDRSVVLPLRGVSALSAPGGPFHDPAADAALFDGVRAALSDDVQLIELDTHINDPIVARTLAERLDAAVQATREGACL